SKYGEAARPLTSLGYKQAVQLLQGQLDREQAVESAQQAHRNYAKRQMTWFRREPEVLWLRGFGDEAEVQRSAIDAVDLSKVGKEDLGQDVRRGKSRTAIHDLAAGPFLQCKRSRLSSVARNDSARPHWRSRHECSGGWTVSDQVRAVRSYDGAKPAAARFQAA